MTMDVVLTGDYCSMCGKPEHGSVACGSQVQFFPVATLNQDFPSIEEQPYVCKSEWRLLPTGERVLVCMCDKP